MFKDWDPTSQETHGLHSRVQQLLMYRKVLAVYCENNTEHMNTSFVQNVIFNIKSVVHIVTSSLELEEIFVTYILYIYIYIYHVTSW
jgi:hypothetical protein